MKRTLKTVVFLSIIICLSLAVLSVVCYAGYSCTQGDGFEWPLKQDRGDSDATTFASVDVTSGDCPGVDVYLNETGSAIVLGGTPTAPGTYTIAVSYTMADGSGSSFFVDLTVTPSEGTDSSAPQPSDKPEAKMNVTKSPTGEEVDEGKNAMFIAAAENYVSVEWRILTKDKNSCWRNENEITQRFPGIVFNAYRGDDGREYMVLDNIPASVNDYYIEAKFTDASGNALFTEPALLKVHSDNPVPEETPEPEPTTAPTEAPVQTSEPAPEPPQATVEIPSAPATDPETPTVAVQEPIKREKRDNTLLYAAAAAGAVLLAGITAVIVRIKIYSEERARKRQNRRH